MNDPDAAGPSSTSGVNTAKPDPINSEFLYYSSVLRVIALALTGDVDRQLVIPWVRKLFRPEYHSAQFREKRNKYLLYLTLTLLNDECYGIFRIAPPSGPLPELQSIEHEEQPMAQWELDPMWRDSVAALPADFQYLSCAVHEFVMDCEKDHDLDVILDQEFQFFLFLARPYASLLNSDDQTKIAAWLQTLCTISGRSCSSMKAIRNDYMMALLGYVHDLRVAGPFREYPPWTTLRPLMEAAKWSAETKPITDPTGHEANEFLAALPIPQDGAFCYIALTGDLIDGAVSQMQ
ncbi:hypothetical protein PPYR_07557 [Photinus pyralis]|uniref:DUF4485 domain-containing protein n=2 Tax=Photinus pyralis TaxID=7054 RepID=A0A5N4AQS4_PHOPY|nr:uncharacterized protein LOC116169553 [Photinus pyralis]XP_031341675.1 uncharacterized protein LOC116169667 [Photinus pyralis]KAB0799677.1 hypothetical protein PPYR_07557 [Photinus pyralis]